MTKPHFRECGLLLMKEVMAFGNREFALTRASRLGVDRYGSRQILSNGKGAGESIKSIKKGEDRR